MVIMDSNLPPQSSSETNTAASSVTTLEKKSTPASSESSLSLESSSKDAGVASNAYDAENSQQRLQQSLSSARKMADNWDGDVNGDPAAGFQTSATTTVPTTVVIPPDGGWGWVVVAASFYCNLIVDGITYSFGMFLTVIGDEFGESRAQVSLIGSLLSGALLVTGPFASALANRYGFRSLTIAGSIIASAAFCASSFARNVKFLYITYGVIGGIGSGLIFVPAVIVIGFYFEKWRGLATGIAVCGSGIGTFVMAPVSDWLIKTYSWQIALRIQAAFLLSCALCGALFRPLHDTSVQITIEEQTSPSRANSTVPLDAAAAAAISDNTKDESTNVVTDANAAAKNNTGLPLLLKKKILRDLGAGHRDRSVESTLSIYEDVGLTATPDRYTFDARHPSTTYFSPNNKYPTASQIFQLDVISDDERSTDDDAGLDKTKEGDNKMSADEAKTTVKDGASPSNVTENGTRNRNRRRSHGYNRGPSISKLLVLSNRELDSTNSYAFAQRRDVRERNKSVSPVLEKRNSCIVPEMRILLDRKYSLQPSNSGCSTNAGQTVANYTKSHSFTMCSTSTLSASSVLANSAADDRSKSIITRRHTDIGNRPLYRDDIFFGSNLKRLPQYASQTSSLDYTMSITRLPTYNDLLEEKKEKFTPFPEAVRRALATLLDISLFKSITFLILAFSGFFTSMGMYIPFVYINDRANQYNIEQSISVWLISVLGITNTIGRVGFGILSSIPKTNAIFINNASMTICGLCTVLSGLSQSQMYQFVYVSVFGLTIACFAALRTIIIVDLLGLENLTNTFGLLLLFQGVAAIIGPPLAGIFVDVTKSYETSFYISGAFIILSAVICYPIEAINRWERNRTNNSSPEKKEIP